MSSRIRGKEGRLRISFEGRPLDKSFYKVSDFKVTPLGDIVEEEFLDEDELDFDLIHNGYQVDFSIHIMDRDASDFVQDTNLTELQRTRPPRTIVTMAYTFREAGAQDITEVFRKGVLRCNEYGAGGRSEYWTASFTGKYQKRDIIKG